MRSLLIRIFAEVSTSSCASKEAGTITLFDACRHYGFKLGLILACFSLASCDTTFNYPSGKTAGRIRSNVTDFSFEGGGITVKAKRIDNATPTHVAFAGATDFGATVAGGVFAFGAPGAVNGITRASVLLAPHVTPRNPPRVKAPATIPFAPGGGQ